MTWDSVPVRAAITAILAPLDPAVTVFDWPPATLNVPAYYVGYVASVAYDGFAFGVDLVTLPITAAAGPEDAARVEAMLRAAHDALAASIDLDGAVASCRVQLQNLWRQLAVAGAQYAAGDLVLEIRM